MRRFSGRTPQGCHAIEWDRPEATVYDLGEDVRAMFTGSLACTGDAITYVTGAMIRFIGSLRYLAVWD